VKTSAWLGAFFLGACASGAPPPPPPSQAPADALCGAGADTVALSTSAEGTAKIEPDPGLGEPRVAWQGDLNEDGTPDYLVSFSGACGNWGECPRGVLVGCREGRARVVWPLDSYAVELEVADSKTLVGGRAWRDLVETRRTGSEGEATKTRTLRFDGKQYLGN